MTEGKQYEKVVEGCGKDPVKFTVGQELAGATHDNEETGDTERKCEVGVTTHGTLIGRKVEYDENGDHSSEVHKKFDDLNQVGSWMDKSKPEEAEVLNELRPLFEESKNGKFDDNDI